MSKLSIGAERLPPWQQAVRARCIHPTGTFRRFEEDDIEQSIPRRFERQVRESPDRLALRSTIREMTYGELNQAANRIAHAILSREGQASAPVALLLEDGVQMIAAILGVLKAGKFYVPLDPSFPKARLAQVLDDSRARLLLTHTRHLAPAGEAGGERVVTIDIDGCESATATDNPDIHASPEALANIVYTSGSTGRPKGVPQSHRNLLHLVRNHTNDLRITAHDRIANIATASVSRVLGALLNGASFFPFDARGQGLGGLAEWLMREGITIYNYFVPTAFRNLVDTLGRGETFPSLRVICLEGEPVRATDLALCKRHFAASCIFTNALGTSETGTIARFFADKDTDVATGSVPVGYPVSGVEVLLLDEGGKVTDPDGVGEIAVRSRFLSPGYWRRPELTDAAFIPDPQGGSDRIYRTGDLGRMLPDGSLMHLGRKDFQAKVRGYRVEAGEVEDHLLAHPDVRRAAVVAREETGGGQRLIGYVVPAHPPGPATSILRSFLADRLPDYMIPSAFVMLDSLPLTATGKLDSRALPPPPTSRPSLSSPMVAPRTPVEKRLLGIWTEVLGTTGIGIDDNFFDLGGHSLLATKVISSIRDTFRTDLPLRAIFETPTVAELALNVVEALAAEGQEGTLERMLAELDVDSDPGTEHESHE